MTGSTENVILKTVTERPADPPCLEGYEQYIRTARDLSVCTLVAQTGTKRTWPTLVLGSGCTQTHAQIEALATVAESLRGIQRPAGVPEILDGEPIGDVSARFARDLIRDRLQLQGQELPRVTAGEGDTWLFSLIAAAAMTARLYWLIKAGTATAPRRWPHQEAAVVVQESWWGVLAFDDISDTTDVFAMLSAADAPRDEDRFLKNTLDLVLNQLVKGLASDEPSLRKRDVDALAELAWLGVTRRASAVVYPGWSDVLLELSNQHIAADEKQVGTPIFDDLMCAQEPLRSRYATLTRTSWDRDRPDLFAAAANLLAQQQAHAVKTKEVMSPPVVSALVTSFDLELEIALMKTGQDFVVVMPVYVSYEGRAHIRWIAVSFAKEDGWRIDDLLRPSPDRWDVVKHPGEYGLPVVVRLTGCPAITLPSLSTAATLCEAVAGPLQRAVQVAAKKAKPDASPEDLQHIEKEIRENNITVEHAVVLRDRDAIWHSATDMTMTSLGSQEKEASQTPFGLPIGVVADNSMYARFWFVLGTQIHDDAIRHRLDATLSLLPMLDAPNVVPRRRYGVAVNRCSTPSDRDQLFWNGFNFVEDDAAKFTDALRHCARHYSERRDFSKTRCCCDG